MNDYKPLERQRLEELYRKQNVRINELEQENRLLKNEIAWLKGYTKYNGITEEEYIDGTMTATEAMLRLQQAEANQQQVMQLTQDLYVLKHTVIAGKTVEEWIKESNTVPEDAMIKEEENNKLKEEIRFLEQCLDNKEKVNKQLRKDIKWYEKEEDRLREENKKLKGDSEELKIWLREKLPLALLKEYMEKFEGVDLKND